MYFPKHNLIFIHNPKTAGTYLLRHLLPLTDATLRYKKIPSEHTVDLLGAFGDRKHSGLRDFQDMLPDDLFAKAKVFTTIRHPVTRMLSWYFFNIEQSAARRKAKQLPPRKGFVGVADMKADIAAFSYADFKKRGSDKPPMAKKFYTLKENKRTFTPPDYILRFETLHEDIERIFPQLGLPIPPDRERINPSNSDDLTAQLAQDPKVIEIVREYHAEDFERFDYE